jgi:hypothetical protein
MSNIRVLPVLILVQKAKTCKENGLRVTFQFEKKELLVLVIGLLVTYLIIVLTGLS